MLIFLCRRLRRCRWFPGTIVNTPPPPLSYLISRTRRLFLVLRWRLRCCPWVLRNVFLCQRYRCHHKLSVPVSTQPPPPSETFTQARSLFCFLCRRLCRRCRVLRLIFLWQRLRHCRQFLRPVIATLQPLLSSSNPCRLSRRLWYLWRVVYSFSSSDASFVVVDSAGSSVWHRRLITSCRSLRRIASYYVLLTPLLSLLIRRARLTLPTPMLWR